MANDLRWGNFNHFTEDGGIDVSFMLEYDQINNKMIVNAITIVGHSNVEFPRHPYFDTDTDTNEKHLYIKYTIEDENGLRTKIERFDSDLGKEIEQKILAIAEEEKANFLS